MGRASREGKDEARTKPSSIVLARPRQATGSVISAGAQSSTVWRHQDDRFSTQHRITSGGLLDLPVTASRSGWHAIEALIDCPKRYQFRHVRGIIPRSQSYPTHFAVGILIHAARAQWLHDGRNGDRWRKQMQKTREDVERASEQEVLDADFRRATLDFEGYVEFWKVRPFPKSLAVEYELKPRGLTPDAPEWAHRTARLDSVERWQGKTWIGECKTTSSSPSRIGDVYSLHGQPLLQAALWGPEEVAKFGPLEGILLDVICKGSGSKKGKGFAPRYGITLGRIQHALSWFRKSFNAWVMQASVVKWNDEVERRGPARGCVGPFGPCPYRDLCLKGRNGTLRFVFEDSRMPIFNWKPEAGKEVAPWA